MTWPMAWVTNLEIVEDVTRVSGRYHATEKCRLVCLGPLGYHHGLRSTMKGQRHLLSGGQRVHVRHMLG